MKKLLFLLSSMAALALIGSCTNCKFPDAEDYTAPVLDTYSFNAATGFTYLVEITEGSGNYSASIDNGEIAAVSVVSEGSNHTLLVVTKKTGTAVITVKDNRSGKTASCSLKVREMKTGMEVAEIRYAIHAGSQTGEIEAELRGSEFPIGSTYALRQEDGKMIMTVNSPDGDELVSGLYTYEELESFSQAYASLPIENQIYYSQRWSVLPSGGKELIYDFFLVSGSLPTRFNMRFEHYRLYEDLTEEYREKYPDADVTAVARLQLCRPHIYYDI